MSKILDESVTANGDAWDFRCPGVDGSPCGVPGGDPFTSTGWPTKKAATERGAQHLYEHKELVPAQTLEEFRAERGIGVDDSGTTFVKLGDL